MKKTMIYFMLSMIIYMVMITYTLPELRMETGGIEIFDMRPGGYTVEEGQLILDNITDRGISFYRHIQLPLDFIYPFLLFVFSFNLWIKVFKKGILYKIRWLTLSVMLFDYMENLGIYWILEKQTSIAITITSWMSRFKAMSTTVIMTILIIGCVYKAYKYFSKKEKIHVKV